VFGAGVVDLGARGGLTARRSFAGGLAVAVSVVPKLLNTARMDDMTSFYGVARSVV
jgi:hypothetical protein